VPIQTVGGLVGEGEGDDLPRLDALAEQVSDAIRDDAGLAAAGAGENEERAIDVRDGGSLGSGERGEQIGRGGGGFHTILSLAAAPAERTGGRG